jgi:hypothetical protein
MTSLEFVVGIYHTLDLWNVSDKLDNQDPSAKQLVEKQLHVHFPKALSVVDHGSLEFALPIQDPCCLNMVGMKLNRKEGVNTLNVFSCP